jgi:DNA-binding NarL/FixJ family response regulator
MKAAATVQPEPIRVIVADDEPLFVEMIQALLSAEEGIEVVASARDGREAAQLAAELAPDAILMDISMPVMDGIDATRQIREHDPRACVLILTGGSSLIEINQAREAGASGFLTKDRIATDLVAELRNRGAR